MNKEGCLSGIAPAKSKAFPYTGLTDTARYTAWYGERETGPVVRVKRITVADSGLLNPAAPEWRNVPRESLSLEPTPLLAQPSVYVQAAWKDRAYGTVKGLDVQAAHDRNIIFFRLSWTDATRDDAITDTDMFPDSAAVLFPVKADAPLASM